MAIVRPYAHPFYPYLPPTQPLPYYPAVRPEEQQFMPSGQTLQLNLPLDKLLVANTQIPPIPAFQQPGLSTASDKPEIVIPSVKAGTLIGAVCTSLGMLLRGSLPGAVIGLPIGAIGGPSPVPFMAM